MPDNEVPGRGTVDLTNCDREPIHLPGSVQPHGCLLACDPGAFRIQRHSANAAEMLQHAGPINGSPLESLLGAEVAHRLRNAAATSNDPARPALISDLALPGGAAFDVAVHRYEGMAIIEFEPSAAGPAEPPLELARDLISRISGLNDDERLVEQTARLVRAAFGYDRVMIYRFEYDGAGQVVSEAKRADLESFLGQHFPASDIPQQARTLYLKNTLRVIGDAACDRVPIEPLIDDTGAPLDLSFAHLRSVSPVHCEYLRNMGVAASMSISVIVGGQLWGLIACHHYRPRRLQMAERVAAEMFGEFFSLHLHALKQKRKLDTAARVRQTLDRFLRIASNHANVEALLRENLTAFAELLPCDGVGLLVNDNWSNLGVAPPAEAVPSLARLVSSQNDGKVWATHALPRHWAPAEAFYQDVSGVLAMPLSQLPRDYLFFFRREVIQTLNWAGNPDKSYETGPLGDRLTPRKSFAIWKETVQRQSEHWSDDDRDIAETTRATLVEIVLRHNELMADERRRADVRQRMLNEELNHRVKNILAIIQSLVGHPLREGRSLEDYVASLKGRIHALAVAHDQVVRGDGGGVLADLLDAELTPYRGAPDSVTLRGPALWLDSRAFSVMALVLHELSTNAAKYGALSQAGGRLEVVWTVTAAGDCEVLWREDGGPPVSPPTRAGFGSVLIDRSVPFDLGGKSEVRFEPEGLRARFLLPARHVQPVDPEKLRQEARRSGLEEPQEGGGMAGDVALLLVEDQMLIAMDVEAMLADNGLTRVTTTASAAEALQTLGAFTPDVAVLDVNLGSETSIPVAEELAKRGVPFIFATGYGDSTMIPPTFSSVPVVRKPYDGDTLTSAISRVLARRKLG